MTLYKDNILFPGLKILQLSAKSKILVRKFKNFNSTCTFDSAKELWRMLRSESPSSRHARQNAQTDVRQTTLSIGENDVSAFAI